MAPQSIAGRYRVEREIGRGGMGSVWLCRDEVLGREVAAKQIGLLPGEAAPDPARAMREARSLAALNHRNVVAVYDAVPDGDHVWLVMEYVAGRTLSQLVEDEGPLPPERVARIGSQVADGLAAAHARGTVHRDVKPGNVLVTADDVAKISDFGIARTAGDAQVTLSGLVIGTPAYFSPELARGEDPSPAGDVWALGATLYAALEGAPPFGEHGNAIALLTTIATERPPQPRRAGFLAEAVGRMMHPDPAARWTMPVAARELRRLHEEHPADGAARTQLLPAPTPAPTPRPTPTPSPTPAPSPAPSPVVPDDEPVRRRWPLLAALAGVVVLAGVLLLAFRLAGDDDGGAGDTAGEDGASSAASAPEATGEETPADGTDGTDVASGEEGPAEESPTNDAPPDDGPTEAPEDFVAGYYAALPDDTATAWSLLSPAFQQETGSLADYEGFWGTVDEVTVDDVSLVGDDAVDVTLTYDTGGSTQTETRRLYLVAADGAWQVDDDEVVG